MITRALWEGVIWSILWILYIYMILKLFPWEMVHDYPEDIKKACTMAAPTSKQIKKGKLVSGIYSLFLFAALAFFGFCAYQNMEYTYLQLFVYLWVIAFIWNLLDLLIVDWLVVCTITPKWVVLEGTQGCKGYKDYGFHFRGFLIGCVYTTVIAALFAGIDFALLKWLIN